MTLNTGRVVRLSAVLASLALLLGLAGTALAAQGDENLPCPDGGHFILQDNTQENIDILVARGLDEGETTGGVTHLFFYGPIDQAVFDMIMEGFEQQQGEQPPLVLSHCLEGATPTPTPTSTPTASPTPTPTASPTPEGSVAGGTSTPTPEQSVQGGTGTPAPSQPDTAMGVDGGPSSIPTVAFGLILLAALGTLAWANVKSARSRV